MSGLGAQSQSLYRKYRPATFNERELVGQEHVSRTLRNAVRFDRVAHAYLFYGPRGCGKTTTARLLAKAVNCLDPDPARRPCNTCTACSTINEGRAVDIIEIDAASNRGIDAMRDLREKVKFSPAQLQTKFYIIDEVHQLTIDAANALLKTLEEPPAHAKFILATTDPEKVPDTISSRCQTFTFRRIPLDRMVERLRDVAAFEQIEINDEALHLIARTATGSLRDALGLLDQLSAFVGGAITTADVRQLLGAGREQEVVAVVDAIAANDVGAGLRAIDATIERGSEARQFSGQVVAYLRDLLLALATNSVIAGVSEAHLASFSLPEVANLVKRFSQIDHAIKHGVYGQLPLELCLVESILARTHQPVAAPVTEARRLGSPADPHDAPAARGAPPRDRVDHRLPAPSARATSTGLSESSDMHVSGNALESQSLSPASMESAQPDGLGILPTPDSTNRGARAPDDLGVSPDAVLLARMREDWPRIRLLVKAVDRKLAAFMASTDLSALRDAEVHVTAESEFHVNMLNQDNNKRVVEGVLFDTYGRGLHVTFMQRNRQGGVRDNPPSAATFERTPRRTPSLGANAAAPVPQTDADTPAVVPAPTLTPREPPPGEDDAVAPPESPRHAVRERSGRGLAQPTAERVSADNEERYVNALRNMFNAVEIKA